MIPPRLLDMLRCPQTGSRVTLADAALVARVNRAIQRGAVTNAGGVRLERLLDGGLVREAGDLLYPVVDEIPVLLPDEAIVLADVA